MNPKHLGQEKIGKLLAKQSAPAVIGMLVMSLYNFVDTIFIGRGVGTEGIAAVSIVFPIQMIIGAFAMALGIGASSVISRKLGEKKYDYVSKIFGTFQTSNISLAIIFMILGLLFTKPLLGFFGATPEILNLGHKYFSILLIGIVFLCFNMGNNNIIRSVGHAKMAMMVMILSSIINIILDGVFIFGFNMGISGAAWATVISRIVGSVIILKYFFSSSNVIKTTISDFNIRRKKLKEIFLVGSSSLARQVAASGVTIFINNLLGIYGGSIAIAAYGIINRALMVFFMPMFGVVQGMQPILGYNHGAGFKHRVKEVTLLSIKVLTIFCVAIFAICFIAPGLLLNIFSTDQELLKMAIPAMRIVILMFPIIGFQVVASGFYQALGKVRPAFWFAIIRQVVIFIPVLYILSKIFGLNGVWYSFPVADFSAAVIVFLVFRVSLRKIN
ncbi:MAG TPA: MATE family efflux transporter [Candidatus Absconditabacterales bacterium]|nr:MATE family efflux transporter [Candidatus Absconditabacterales bacterium]